MTAFPAYIQLRVNISHYMAKHFSKHLKERLQ